jgi:peroxiredoxin
MLMRNKLLFITILAGILFISFINGSPEPREGLEVGNKIPNINRPLIDGTPFNTDSLRGKMVLLDFWASFDAKSRVESYKKIEMLNRYQNQSFNKGSDFVIVSVSLDRFKSPLMQVINRDNLHDMYHICSYEGRESEMAKLLNPSNEMTNYLIDGDGLIVAVANDMNKIDNRLMQLKQ